MSSLFSDRWHHVASLRPTLSPRATPRRQRVRGTTWMLLQAAGGHALRLNPAAWGIAGRLSGVATVGELWAGALERAEDVPTQDEVIELVASLREASLLAFDVPVDAAGAAALRARTRSAHAVGHAFAPLSWRLRLGDPTPLLAPLRPLARVLFSRGGGIGVALALVLLALLAALHASVLAAHARAWMATSRYVVLALLLYAPVKALHELAHGLAVLRFGGRVRSAGVTLMMLMPSPWVDASASASFPGKAQRVVVGAAGVLAELVLACLALCAWLRLDDGLLRDAAFVTLAITGVSAIVFNANPLQRLDGYFVFTDLLGLPNLAQRSRAWWQQALRRALFDADGADLPTAAGEAPWLALYAPSAWLFGVLLAAWAVRWLGACSAPLGIAAAAVLGWQSVLRPVAGLLRELGRASSRRADSARRWRIAGALLATVAVAGLAVPLPQRRTVPGVVWPGDDALLRAGEDGFVDEVVAQPSTPVHAGDVVLRLSNPELEARLARVSARAGALEAGLLGAVQDETGDATRRESSGGGRAADARADLAAAQAELAQLRTRVDALTVRAQRDGQLSLAGRDELPGRYVQRGSLLGQVLTGGAPRVRVAWPQTADLPAAGAAEIHLASAGSATLSGRLEPRAAGGAVLQLPSAALSQRHGGAIATDPADHDDLRTLQPVVLLDIQADGAPAGAAARTGERCWVSVPERDRPWGWVLLQAARRQFLQFGPRT